MGQPAVDDLCLQRAVCSSSSGSSSRQPVESSSATKPVAMAFVQVEAEVLCRARVGPVYAWWRSCFTTLVSESEGGRGYDLETSQAAFISRGIKTVHICRTCSLCRSRSLAITPPRVLFWSYLILCSLKERRLGQR